jgi:hypothetical protein
MQNQHPNSIWWWLLTWIFVDIAGLKALLTLKNVSIL